MARFEDPDEQARLHEAAIGLPFAPRAIHDPAHPIPGEPGGTTHDIVFCPDCGRTVISALDAEIERAGMHFRMCWDLRPFGVPEDVRPCHPTCLIACGRQTDPPSPSV
jgi:hypothetical protein